MHSHLFQHRLDHWPEHKVKKNDAQLLKDNSLVTDEMFVKLEHFGICLDTTSPGGKSEDGVKQSISYLSANIGAKHSRKAQHPKTCKIPSPGEGNIGLTTLKHPVKGHLHAVQGHAL